MTAVEQLQVAIESLPPIEFTRLRKWFAEKDWERWDQQLEADVSQGKLNFLLEEALFAKACFGGRR